MAEKVVHSFRFGPVEVVVRNPADLETASKVVIKAVVKILRITDRHPDAAADTDTDIIGGDSDLSPLKTGLYWIFAKTAGVRAAVALSVRGQLPKGSRIRKV